MSRHGKLLLACFALLIAVGGAFCVFRAQRGYWPIPQICHVLYWEVQYEKAPLSHVVVDPQFRLDTARYTVARVVTSPYPLWQNLILNFPPNQTNIAPYYRSTATFRVEIRDGDELIYQNLNVQPRNRLMFAPVTRMPSHTFGLLIDKLPFPINGRTYRDLRLTVEVVNLDTNLSDSIPVGQLVLSPDLSL